MPDAEGVVGIVGRALAVAALRVHQHRVDGVRIALPLEPRPLRPAGLVDRVPALQHQPFDHRHRAARRAAPRVPRHRRRRAAARGPCGRRASAPTSRLQPLRAARGRAGRGCPRRRRPGSRRRAGTPGGCPSASPTRSCGSAAAAGRRSEPSAKPRLVAARRPAIRRRAPPSTSSAADEIGKGVRDVVAGARVEPRRRRLRAPPERGCRPTSTPPRKPLA